MKAEPTVPFPDLLSSSFLSRWRGQGDAGRSPAFPPGPPIVSVHVPKTAGTSFADYLFRVLDRPFAIRWDAIDEDLETFLAADGQYGAANGHIEHRHVLRCIEHPRPFRFTTFIRHPVDRAVSNYTYCASDRHPSHAEFVQAFPTIDESIDWGGMSTNYLARVLVGGADSAQEFIDKAVAIYDFIGTSSAFNLSSFLFSLAFGMPFEGPLKRMNTAAERQGQSLEVPQAAIDRLHEVNAVDLGFFEFVHGLYMSKADTLFALALEPERTAH